MLKKITVFQEIILIQVLLTIPAFSGVFSLYVFSNKANAIFIENAESIYPIISITAYYKGNKVPKELGLNDISWINFKTNEVKLKNGYLVTIGEISRKYLQLGKTVTYQVSIAGYKSTKTKEIEWFVRFDSLFVLSCDLDGFREGVKYYLENCDLKPYVTRPSSRSGNFTFDITNDHWVIIHDLSHLNRVEICEGEVENLSMSHFYKGKYYPLNIKTLTKNKHAEIFINNKCYFRWRGNQSFNVDENDVRFYLPLLYSDTFEIYPYEITFKIYGGTTSGGLIGNKNRFYLYCPYFVIKYPQYDYSDLNLDKVLNSLKRYDK